jgi:para-nitrobenzyl esterase
MAIIEHVEVETPFGRLHGARSEGVAAFRRVPYAEVPIGPKRFEMPGAAPRWSGVRDATLAAPVPPQLPSRLDAVNGVYEAEQSEDCLHLDIWTSHRAGDRAPVLVFIHGGAFMTGGGSLACYDGSTLARENGLVVVNITYRLGILGFWPQPDFGALNLGLHDQVAALRWIKQAIGCFGGDPDRITVAGQSAGGFSIAVMLGTAIGRDLFHRAILISAPVGIRLRTVDEAKPLAATLLDVLGLKPNEAHRLRDMPTAQIFDRLRGLQKRPPAIPGDITPPFMPVLDGTLIPRDPIELLKGGSAGWCDTMIGATREEYAAFSISNPGLDNLSDDELLGLFRRELGEAADAALKRIRAQRVPRTPRTILGDLHSEQMFIKPSLAIADVQAKIGRNVFSYLFDWQSPNPGYGACHCIELPFLFGNMDVWKAAPMLNGADRREVDELSRLFRGTFAAFAEKGDPNGDHLPNWPSYNSGRAVLHFDRKIAASGWID